MSEPAVSESRGKASDLVGDTFASNSVLLAALEQAPDAIIICDRHGVIEYANRSIVTMLGYTQAELLGETVELLVPDRVRESHVDHRKAFDSDPSTRPMGLDLTLFARHRSGREVPVEISLSPVMGATDGRVIAVVRDVGERRHLLEQIAEAHSRLVVSEDRERIARDLHDTVIQRLFATGMTLQAAVGQPNSDERIDVAVASIDEAIRDLRNSIFSLRRSADPISVGDAVLATVEEARRTLDCVLDIRIGKDVDYRVPPRLRSDLVAVVRESLTNVMKHAAAREVSVELIVEGDHIVVRINDDGAGFQSGQSTGGYGLQNLRDRASQMGGKCEIDSSVGGGTRITFAIPLTAS